MLAVAALAAQRPDPVEAPRPPPQRPARAAVTPALRAFGEGQQLDLNLASAEELALVPGIGPKLAQRILDERARRGGFTAWGELRAVRGIGPKTLERLKAFLRVTPQDQSSKKYESDTPALKYTGHESSAVSTNTERSCTPNASSRETSQSKPTTGCTPRSASNVSPSAQVPSPSMPAPK